MASNPTAPTILLPSFRPCAAPMAAYLVPRSLLCYLDTEMRTPRAHLRSTRPRWWSHARPAMCGPGCARISRALLFLLLTFLLGLDGEARTQQAPGLSGTPPSEKGAVIESVACAANPDQTYALFLPSSYTPDRPWPVLYAFDPGANGSVPVRLLQETAETHGYIVAGSNNSRNGPLDLQWQAANAVWGDTHSRFNIDDRRVYVAGFSGGARFATYLALTCNCVTGVIAHGAGFPSQMPPTASQPRFNYFAAIGLLDFNYAEIVELEPQLEEAGFVHRIRHFPGQHQWAPAEVWAEAIEWMELLAMREGRRAQEKEFITRRLADRLQIASNLEEAGELYSAYREYRSLLEEFEGLVDTAALARKAESLADSKAVREARKREQAEVDQQRRLTQELAGMLEALRTEPVGRGLTVLELQRKVRQLKERLRRTEESPQAAVLQRSLGKIFAFAYEDGVTALEEEESSLAVSYFEIAAEIASRAPMPFFLLARAHAQGGNRKGALRALGEAVERGFTSEVLLRDTKEFVVLKDDEAFQQILDSLGRGSNP